MAWRSSRSRPSRVPASRASIRARWKRITLRPASARWSSAATPGVRPTTRRLSGGTASSASGLRASDVVGPISGAAAAPASPPSSRGSPLTPAPSPAEHPRTPPRTRPRRPRRHRSGAPPARRAFLGVTLASDATVARAPAAPAVSLIGVTIHTRAVSTNRGQPRLQLASRLGDQRRIGVEHGCQLLQRPLVALDQLRLELHEALDDPRLGHDVDLIEAQFDARLTRTNDAPAPNLAERHQLQERCVAGQLEHERPGVRRRPIGRWRRTDPPGPRPRSCGRHRPARRPARAPSGTRRCRAVSAAAGPRSLPWPGHPTRYRRTGPPSASSGRPRRRTVDRSRRR